MTDDTKGVLCFLGFIVGLVAIFFLFVSRLDENQHRREADAIWEESLTESGSVETANYVLSEWKKRHITVGCKICKRDQT